MLRNYNGEIHQSSYLVNNMRHRIITDCTSKGIVMLSAWPFRMARPSTIMTIFGFMTETITFVKFYRWHITQSFVRWWVHHIFTNIQTSCWWLGHIGVSCCHVLGFVPHNYYQSHRRQSLDPAIPRCVGSVMQFHSLLPWWVCLHQTTPEWYYSDVHHLNCLEPLLCWSMWVRGFDWNATA